MALLNPYLNFRGQAREAMEFYQTVLGGELTVSTFGDFQMPGVDDDEKDSIMHGQLTTSAGFTLMGSDVPAKMPGEISNGTISISGNETDEIRGYFDAPGRRWRGRHAPEPGTVGRLLRSADRQVRRQWLVNIAGPGQPQG